MYKKRDARAKLLFCQSKPIAFLRFSLPSPSSLLKLPNDKKVNLKGRTIRKLIRVGVGGGRAKYKKNIRAREH